jgi:hypothetical protein
VTEYQVLLVLGEVLGLFFLVGKPIIKLNSTLTEALVRLDAVSEQGKSTKSKVEQLEEKNSCSHKEIYEHLEAHDLILENHKMRLERLEDE